MLSQKVQLLIITLVWCITANDSYATIKSWLGSTNDSWNVSTNWSPSGVPNSQDTVYMGYGDFIVIPSGYTAQIKRLRVLGTLVINGGLTVEGGQLYQAGTLTNYGTINITNSPTYGLEVHSQSGFDALLYNYGDILIYDVNGYGIKVWTDAAIYNYSVGLIRVENYTSVGLELIDTVFNYGEFLIDESGTEAIYADSDEAYFYNYDCGSLRVLGEINWHDGTFVNEGHLRQRNEHNNTIDVAITNLGCIEDREDNFTYSDISNQGIIVAPYHSLVEEGDSIPIFSYGSITPANIDVLSIYTSSALTTSAGTFDNNHKVWVPNTDAVGKTSFFAEIVVDNYTCPSLVRVDLDDPVEGTNYWLGGTGQYSDASKWSKGTVPLATEKARIYDPSALVYIEDSDIINVRKLMCRGTIEIQSGGELRLLNNPDGLYAFDCEGCNLINEGTITISSVDLGLYVDKGYVENTGNITCQSSNVCIYVGPIMSTDTDHYVLNQPLGIIQGDDCKLISGSTLPVINQGLINATNCPADGLSCHHLGNSGVIEISGTFSNTATGLDISTLENSEEGTITISKFQTGAYINDAENHGILNIDSTQNIGLSISGDFLNAANITISDADVGLRVNNFISTEGLENQGSVVIANIGTTGLEVSGEIDNQGSILLDSVYNIGLELSGSLNNQSSGSVLINNTLLDGCHIDNGYLSNEAGGILTIKNTGRYGIQVTDGSFTNDTEASFTIDSCGSDGIYLSDDAIFTNYGDGFVKDQVNGYSIQADNTCTILNGNDDGHLRLYKPFLLQGAVTNTGIWSQLADLPVLIYPTFANTGIVYDPHGVLDSPFFLQEGAYLTEVMGSYAVGDTIHDPIELNYQSTASYEFAPDWHLDANLTEIGGAYLAAENKLVILPTAYDSTRFYVRARDAVHNTIDTFLLELSESIDFRCGNVTWQGGTGLWSEATNWDQLRTPTSCDTVSVLNATDSVLIDPFQQHTVQSVNNFGTLLIRNNATLTVDGAAAEGFNNRGALLVNGSLQILNAGTIGYRGRMNSMLINNGEVLIDQAGTIGLQVSNAQVDHKAAAHMVIEHSGIDNIQLTNGAILYIRGLLESRE